MNSVRDYLLSLQQRNSGTSGQYEISSCPQLIERIQQLGFLPLLDSGIDGYCAEEMMAPDYHYVQFDDGSWEWPLWTWKGPAITEGNCVYGKFFGGKNKGYGQIANIPNSYVVADGIDMGFENKIPLWMFGLQY